MTSRAEQKEMIIGITTEITDLKTRQRVEGGLMQYHEHVLHPEDAPAVMEISPKDSRQFADWARGLVIGNEAEVSQLSRIHQDLPEHHL